MKLRIGIGVLVLSLVSTASAVVTAQQAGILAGDVSPNGSKASFLSASPTNGGAQFMLLKTSNGYRLLALLIHEDDTVQAPTTQFTVDLVMNLAVTKQGSEIVSLDEDALAGLAAGSADIDPAAYLRSTVALKRLTSMVAGTLNDPDAVFDGSDPELSKSLQNAMDANLKTNASQTENNALSLVAPSSTHKNVVLTLAKDDNGYHFQILVAGDEAGEPAPAVTITVKDQDIQAILDEDVLARLGLEIQDLAPSVVGDADIGPAGTPSQDPSASSANATTDWTCEWRDVGRTPSTSTQVLFCWRFTRRGIQFSIYCITTSGGIFSNPTFGLRQCGGGFIPFVG